MKVSLLLTKLFTCFLLLSWHFPVTAQAKTGKVSLSGVLKNFNNQVEIEDMSAFQYLLPASSKRVIIPDSSGHFKTSFTITAPSYFRLGRNQLYLSPGDEMEIFVDKANPKL